ncbi:MAG: ABC transporter permease [Chitinispirillia bacterium]|nr:ABC transporter permease [Chitinispirillia bacterium]
MEKSSRKYSSSLHSFFNLGWRSFTFYLRGNLLLSAGSAVGALILTGALLIGFSLRESIHSIHEYRLGKTQWLLHSSSSKIRASLADSITAYSNVKAAPILLQTGSVGVVGQNNLVHRVNIIGVDDRFWEFGPDRVSSQNFGDDAAIVNSALAQKLNLKFGDQIILRFQSQGSLAMDAPFGVQHNLSSIRLPVSSIASSEEFGDFSLKSEHFLLYNVFVPLKLLQLINDVPEMASAIIIRKLESSVIAHEEINAVVNSSFRLRDVGLSFRRVGSKDNKDKKDDKENDDKSDIELFSDHIFISDYVRSAIVGAIPQAVPISSWFVNSISKDERFTPYSFVSTPAVEYSLGDNSIELGSWIAKDLNANIGDSLTLTYFVPAQTSGLRLDSAHFAVSAIHKEKISWIDRSLMPPYPGLADAGSCTDWDPSIPVDLHKIRPKDEEYWAVYEGTPKAIINFNKASKIWDNRFGVCTAIRFPAGLKSTDEIEAILLGALSPANSGIQLTNVRELVDNAVSGGIDFAPLFIGLSFFTLFAAFLLIWLLSTLQVKSRSSQQKLLTALGYSRKHILSIYLSEGVIIFSIGTVAGVLLSPLYTFAIIQAMKTVWHAAAQAPSLDLHVGLMPFLFGGGAAFVFAMISMFFAVRCLGASPRPGRCPGMMMQPRWDKEKCGNRHQYISDLSINRFVFINLTRDKKRTFGQIAILASALLILGVTQIFHHKPVSDHTIRSSGTGGFYWYGELNSGISKEHFNARFLRESGVNVNYSEFLSIGMRVRDGDDASCLNLNKTAAPVIVGVDQRLLDSLGAFSFSSIMNGHDKSRPWLTLGTINDNNNTVYGIADAATIEWGLGKSLGDQLKLVNEKGDTLNIILAASLKSTVLQGKVIIAESDFIRHFPSISGYRLFLSAPSSGKEKMIEDALLNAHNNSGLNLELTTERLNGFNSVENTYLSIFALLGMMGLMLGCGGLGIILLSDIEERRYELALLMVQGFSMRFIKRLLFSEYMIIAFAGTAAGLLPALIVSWTAIQVSGLLRIAYLLAIVLLCSAGSIALGLRTLRKDNLLEILKKEM